MTRISPHKIFHILLKFRSEKFNNTAPKCRQHSTFCPLGNYACFFVVYFFFFKIIFSEKFFQEYNQSVKQFGSRSSSVFLYTGSIGILEILSRYRKIFRCQIMNGIFNPPHTDDKSLTISMQSCKVSVRNMKDNFI